LRVKPVFREHCDVLVTEDLNMRIGMGVTERVKAWQSKNEITDCATADYQNSVHASPVATALRAVLLSN
jgi:cytochrome c-type biogenesis protein CcmH/NrfF